VLNTHLKRPEGKTMGVKYRSTVITLPTTKDSCFIDVWVSFDECYGGFYVAAKVVEIHKGIKITTMFGKYATRPLNEFECVRGSTKKLEGSADLAAKQIGRKSGASWDAVVSVCKEAGVELKEEVTA
jgi:hypothetical protein